MILGIKSGPPAAAILAVLVIAPPARLCETFGKAKDHDGLRSNGPEVVAIHHHVTSSRPMFILLHYWGRGPAE